MRRELSDSLHERVAAFIEGSLRSAPPEPFDALALAIARFQATYVPALGRLCRARGVDLEAAVSADVIPALPCDVFRLARISAFGPEDDACVFRTSGTSLGAEARGEHPLRTTKTYELGALAWGSAMLWPEGLTMDAIVLAPPVEESADSSLGFMLDKFAKRVGGAVSFHLRSGVLDVAGVAVAAAEARAAGRPALVLGTSFAFVFLLDGIAGSGRLPADFRLPEGSRVMQTGGFKGRSREVSPDELRRSIAALFSLPASSVVSEYGMTELSSQLYEGTLSGPPSRGPGFYLAPPWLRVTAVDPTTLAPLGPGETGILRFVDLANVDSSVAIQTSDLGRVTADGVELFGRIPGATPRGCSLAVEELFSSPT